LRAAHGFAPEDIAEIVATGGEVQLMLVEPAASKQAPATAIDAKFSIPFTIAAALIDLEVTLDSYDAASLADPRKRGLAAKVRFERHPDWGRERAASGGLAIRLNDGRRLESWIDMAAGHFSQPIDDKELEAKFRDCAGRARHPLSAGDAVALARAIWSLDQAPDGRVALGAISYVA